MSLQNLIVIFIVLVISLSGIFINLVKKGENEKIKFSRDDASLMWFRILVPLALVLSLLIYFFKIGNLSLSFYFVYIGGFLVGLGLIIRWIGIISLGKAFTVKVSILEDHSLKTNGIYTYVRHPSYTGLLIYYLGLGLVMQNWMCIIILTVFPVVAVINRIQIEEKVLVANFSDSYKNYQKRSWRLFPFLY